MSEVRSRIPFDNSTGKYRASWQPTQEDQVSHQTNPNSLLNRQTDS